VGFGKGPLLVLIHAALEIKNLWKRDAGASPKTFGKGFTFAPQNLWKRVHSFTRNQRKPLDKAFGKGPQNKTIGKGLKTFGKEF